MNDALIIIFSTMGALFILIAALGVYRMPDFYTRLSVTVKAATIGVGCILGSAAFHFSDFAITTKVFAVIFFLLITSPVGAFLIARVAYMTGVKLWDKSIHDELKENIENKTNEKTKVIDRSEEPEENNIEQ